MLMNKRAISGVSELLKANHFYRPLHGQIYTAITSLAVADEAVDAVTVKSELEKRGLLKKIGGAPYLHTLIKATPIEMCADAYARIVFDKWRQREVIRVGQQLCQLGYTDATCTEEVDSLIASADVFFRDLGEPSSSGLMWDDLVDKWRSWQVAVGDVIPTPWPDMNKWFPGGGFHPGQLVIVGGRPGQGKSNAGLNVALGAAEHNCRTVVFTVEMDDVEVASRLLAAGSWTQVRQLFSKEMDVETAGRVENYISDNKGMPLEVVDQPYITVEQIVAHCRSSRPKVIFVDYAQLIQPSNSKLQRHEQVAHITRSLKVAAKALQMVVVVAAQLKRPEYRRDDTLALPKIEDLRESGAAEQDADIVILLHRPENAPHIWMVVGKNRNGPTGKSKVMFRGDVARIG